MSKNKYIYLAGIIDGEGTMDISRCNRGSYFNYYGRLTVKNTDLRLMRWLIDNFGGSYHQSGKPKKVNHAIAYQWYFKGGYKKQEVLLLALMPYLILKKEQAVNLLNFDRLNGTTNPEKREEYYQISRSLNQRGPTVTTNMQDSDNESEKIESELMGDHESELMVT